MRTRKKNCARAVFKNTTTRCMTKNRFDCYSPLESKEASTTNDRHLPNPPAPLRTPNQKSNGPSLRCSQVLELFLRWHNLVKIKITVRLHLLNRLFNCIQNSMCALLVHWVFFCNMAKDLAISTVQAIVSFQRGIRIIFVSNLQALRPITFPQRFRTTRHLFSIQLLLT